MNKGPVEIVRFRDLKVGEFFYFMYALTLGKRQLLTKSGKNCYLDAHGELKRCRFTWRKVYGPLIDIPLEEL